MTLASGQRLLHFTLVEKIGRGGMGEVWRALDTTLDRQVAIKVLPAELAGDPERVARLEREAKLLASLSHPNIAAIFGFPEAELPGSDERIRFLAMELVRGEDFAQIVARGPLPLREALDAARQIAAALEAAHDAGVIHRDLKPANVKRTPEGEIKVLDFGLAKAAEPAAAPTASQLAHSPTMTIGATVQGVILGTVSYMSPEQARGFAVDRRTDLWAFGCVLYELLAGRPAFDGETVTDVLAAVVQREPDWEALPAATPSAVRRLLRRCLEKTPKRRLRDAGDASLLLDENPEDSRSISVGVPVALPAPPRMRPGIAALLGALLGLAVAAGVWMVMRSEATAAPAAARFQRLTFGRGMMRAARFAPDGRTIVYGASWDGPPVRVHLTRTDSTESAALATPPGELLAVSRSGEVAVSLGHSYYGYMGEGTLARTTLLGGEPKEMLEHVRVADWSPDGSTLAVVRPTGGIDQLEYPPGTILDKTTGYFADVRVSPDGELVAYTEHPLWGDNQGSVAVIDRHGAKKTLASGYGAVQGLAWGPSGKEVWYTTGEEDGAARLIATDLAGRSRDVHADLGGMELFDIAADGRVLVGREQNRREVLALLDGFAEPRLVAVRGESSLARGMTRDGRAVLVTSHSSTVYHYFLVRSDRPGALLLGEGDGLAISRDGARALSSSSDYQRLFVTPFGAGSARAVPLPDEIALDGLATWHPNGRQLIAIGRKAGESSRALLVDVESGRATPFGLPGAGWATFTPPPVSS
ncbi:MAG: protein kinase domain-containing protein, partial [Myxococcota bacterium]